MSNALFIRVPNDFKKKLNRLAEEKSLSLSSYVRMVLVEAIERIENTQGGEARRNCPKDPC